jgi:hypothetical protein
MNVGTSAAEHKTRHPNTKYAYTVLMETFKTRTNKTESSGTPIHMGIKSADFIEARHALKIYPITNKTSESTTRRLLREVGIQKWSITI